MNETLTFQFRHSGRQRRTVSAPPLDSRLRGNDGLSGTFLKQIWAVENPERFYEGGIDWGWQRRQTESGE